MTGFESFCVIVDPYVNTQYLINQFKKNHIQCIAVLSEPISPEMKKNRLPVEVEQQFYAVQTLADGEDTLVQYLKNFNLIGIVNGSDMGVELTDRLGFSLKLPNTNQPEHSLARRNKYSTNQVIQKHNIPCTTQILLDQHLLDKIGSDDSILNGSIDRAETVLSYPLVLKPTQSRGTFGVRICYHTKDLRAAIVDIVGAKDVYGQRVSELVIEELLIGKEYAIDTISLHGQHYIAGIYLYEKEIINGKPIYRDMTLIDSSSEEVTIITGYVHDILTAVDFNYGAAHIEVFLTDAGPKLVEINPRISGAFGFANQLCKKLTGRDQIEMLVESYVNPNSSLGKYSSNYIKTGYGKVVMLQNFKEGILSHYSGLQKVQQLPSFCDIVLPLRPGEIIRKTTDFCTCPGVVLLINQSLEQLNFDFQRLVMIEKAELFCVKSL